MDVRTDICMDIRMDVRTDVHTDVHTDVRTDVQDFSPFYRTWSPVRAAAQNVRDNELNAKLNYLSKTQSLLSTLKDCNFQKN